jgi:hypothetical protein
MGVPFECDLCSFRNVVGRDPDESNQKDKFTLTAIRRVLLDVMLGSLTHWPPIGLNQRGISKWL